MATSNMEALAKIGEIQTNVSKLEEMGKGYDVGNNAHLLERTMNVDEVSRLFEVHGNSVQNWFKRGGIGSRIDLPDNNVYMVITDFKSDLFIQGSPQLGSGFLEDGEGHGLTTAYVAVYRIEDGRHLKDIEVALKMHWYR